MATTNNGIANGTEEQEREEEEQQEEEEDYRNFVSLQGAALRSSGVPPLYWKTLFYKLSREVCCTPTIKIN